MPRVREIEDPGDDPLLKDTYAKEQAAKQLSLAVERSGLLPPQLLALVSLRVALINGCPF
jgi:alkylhydroperoxidase family enzyme